MLTVCWRHIDGDYSDGRRRWSIMPLVALTESIDIFSCVSSPFGPARERIQRDRRGDIYIFLSLSTSKLQGQDVTVAVRADCAMLLAPRSRPESSGAVSWQQKKRSNLERLLLFSFLLLYFKAAAVVLDSLSPLESAHPRSPACSATSSSLRPSPEPRSHRVRPPLRPSQRRSLTTTTSYVPISCTRSRRAGPSITRG